MIICQRTFRYTPKFAAWMSDDGITLDRSELAKVVNIPSGIDAFTVTLHNCCGKQRVRLMVAPWRVVAHIFTEEPGVYYAQVWVNWRSAPKLRPYANKHVWMKVTYTETESEGE